MVSFIRGNSRLAVFKEVSVCSASCQTYGFCGIENMKLASKEERRW